MTVTLPTTSRTSSDALQFNDCYVNDLALKTAVDDLQATVAGSGTDIPDSGLASPNNSVYKTIFQSGGYFGSNGVAGTPAGTYLLTAPSANAYAPTSGGTITPAAGSAVPIAFYFASGDYSVGSLTTKLRIRAQAFVNATAPAVTYTVGLYPVTVAGGSNALALTVGSLVTGSGTALTTPAASTVTSAVTAADITIPSDGAYLLGVVSSGTPTNNSMAVIRAQLQVRNV